MSRIHPTAIVDPKAELARDVSIGPYAVVGPRVTLGPATQVMSHAVITGRTTLGARNRIWHHAVLGAEPQDLKYTGEDTTLALGDDNDIREFVTMHPGTANGDGTTTVGDRNLFMVGAHVAHDSHVGCRCVLGNNVLLAGHITIDDDAVISGGAAIHHYVHVGRYAFIGGNSGVVHDAPPYMNSDGHPARVRSVNFIGLHRHGIDGSTIENLKEVCRLLYKRERGNQAQVIDAVEADFGHDPACKEVCRFARTTAQGPNGRRREADRKDNKRKSPTR